MHGADALEVLYVPWAEEVDEATEQSLRASLGFPSFKSSAITPQLREVLKGIFGEVRSPMIALISGDGQEILNPNAVREIYETMAEGYPWTAEALAQVDAKKAQELERMRSKLSNFQIFENLLVRGKERVAASSLTENKLVGLYFSAHWCGPCQAFTPILASVYKELKEQNKQFEVIFISSDENEIEFDRYFESMPWLALQFAERDLKGQLSELFEGAEFFPWSVEDMKNYEEVKELRETEAKARALAQEGKLAEEQRERGNGVLARLRGQPGTSTFTVDHEITFTTFDTIGAPANIINKGSFFYEIEVVCMDKGIQQFGWADADFTTSDEREGEGAGDDENSFAADGARVQKWHNGSEDFGQAWQDGDVIGCAANLEEGTVLFGVNGNWEAPMGVAFEGIAPTGGLYPCLTASNGTFRVNLGSRPFKFGPPNATFVGVVVK